MDVNEPVGKYFGITLGTALARGGAARDGPLDWLIDAFRVTDTRVCPPRV